LTLLFSWFPWVWWLADGCGRRHAGPPIAVQVGAPTGGSAGGPVSSPCWLLSAGSGLGGHCVGCPPPQVSRERSRRRIHRLGTRASEGRPRWIGSGAGTIAGRMASKGSGQDGPRRRCFLGHAGRQPHWAASFDWPSTPEEARIIVQGALTVTAALPRSRLHLGVGQAACSPTSATTGPSRAPRCSRRPAGRYPAVPGPASAAGYGQTVALPGGDHLLGGRPSSSARLLGQASASEGNAWESGIPIRSSTDNTWRSSPSGLTCSSDWANLTQKSVEIIPSGKDSPNARPGSWLQAGRSADACGALGGNAPLGVGVRSPLGVGVRSPLVTHAAPR
jgi:hypothetical protein